MFSIALCSARCLPSRSPAVSGSPGWRLRAGGAGRAGAGADPSLHTGQSGCTGSSKTRLQWAQTVR
eukprot:6949187-Alexandrium_andersonii.AAC.1